MRVQQMGGGNPRSRLHNYDTRQPQSPRAALQSLLPLLLLFIIPLLWWLFSGSAPTYPSVQFDNSYSRPPYTLHRASERLKVHYWTDPRETGDYSTRNWRDLDSYVEGKYISRLRAECEWEQNLKQRAFQDAQGFWSRDEIKWQRAKAMTMPACDKLEGWGRGPAF